MENNVTNRLKILRKQAGLTQMELAKKAGLSQAHIANIENGKRDIDFGAAMKLARALNIKACELLPLEEQTEEVLTDEEKEFICLFRKSKATNGNAETSAKAE